MTGPTTPTPGRFPIAGSAPVARTKTYPSRASEDLRAGALHRNPVVPDVLSNSFLPCGEFRACAEDSRLTRLFVTIGPLPEMAATLRVLLQAGKVTKSKNAFTKDVFPCLARRSVFPPSLAVSVSRDSVWR